MRWHTCVAALVAGLLSANAAMAQHWGFDARTVALGGVGGSGNLATGMIDEQRPYRTVVLPLGLIQILSDRTIYDPQSSGFDLVRVLESTASPNQFVLGRNSNNAGQASFVSDIRNATVSRDLTRYRGFSPDNELLAEGLAAPDWGYTFKIRKDARGGFQGVFVGAGPYLSMRAAGTVDDGFTRLLATGVNVANAHFPITNSDEGQLALAVTTGYRGRFGWPAGIGTGSTREGLYVAANYNYLRGFQYQKLDMTIRLDTDNTGLIFVRPGTTPISMSHGEATQGTGFAVDLGVGAVIDRWEVGLGARGVGNRITWTGVRQTTYSLASLLSGDSDFRQTAPAALGDAKVELPVDYRGNVGYYAGPWSAAVEVGHGFGGGSFHGGYERRIGPFELRGGARYSTTRWNPTAGVGFDFTPRVSMDVAASGTTANLERTRQLALAVSFRLNQIK